MPIINSTSQVNKFDALIRTNKGSTLMSFIIATYNTLKSERNESDILKRKQNIAKRLKSAYDLYRENQSGSYGNGERSILDQFESQYTIGHEMGIWLGKDFNLNELAIEVADNKITVREYIGIVFLNLFTYYKNSNKNSIYHHFLYEILKDMNNLESQELTKDMIEKTLPFEDKKKREQVNLIFNYLSDSDFFDKIDDNSIRLNNKWGRDVSELMGYCNLEYQIKSKDEAYEMAKNKEEYAKYVTQNWIKSKNSQYIDDNYKKVCDIQINKPHQRIFFGAPGTGKSYQLNKEAKEYFGINYERVTFHPNYMYGNFVGAFKPFPNYFKDKEGNFLTDEYGNKKESITYMYVEGPLMRILVRALKNPDENYLLLIEEINRANTAAVFGDFFQLLDRKSDGESEYPITTSKEVRIHLDKEISSIENEEIKEYISNKIGIEYERLIIPNNLYIWATMNSADQGVMPMDTAFKRRWNFEYIGINDALNDLEIAKEFDEYKFKITKDRIAKWNDFRVEVNKKLSYYKVPEDKLIGPYFISKSVLDSKNIELITKNVKNKVLMYIYDDAGKPHRNSIFVSEKATTYSELCKNFDENGNAIFKNPMNLGEEIIKNHSTNQSEDYKIEEKSMFDIAAESSNTYNKE